MLECFEELEMKDTFIELCKKKCELDADMIDAERMSMASVFVVGQSANTDEIQIQRFSRTTNSWKMAVKISDLQSYFPHIHYADNLLYLLAYERNSEEIEVIFRFST